jgi:hypothetical protein
VFRVIIETRKESAREKNRERERGERNANERRRRKKGCRIFSLTANQLHDTTHIHKKNGETAALSLSIHPSHLYVC